MNGLMLHAGAQPVEYDALRAFPTPEATETHVPIPHHSVVDYVKHSLTFFGHEIMEQHFGVTEDGMRFFGVLTLKSPYGDYTDTVGLRNSHDKRFPIGIAFGSRVFVCDNLAFVADMVVRRKHTANAKRDLPGLVAEIVEPLAITRQKQHETFELYRGTAIEDTTADQAIMAMYRQGVINLQRIGDVVKQWDEPVHDWGEKTAWRLFNAATFALTGRVAENPSGTATLHRIIDGYCQTVN